ncbi:MAG: hypothetical protein Q9206_003572 [Seirophora lacunosa]
MSKVISALGAAVVGAAVVLGQECAAGSAKEIAGNLSMHFRGPLRLRQLAVYYPDAGSNAIGKRSVSAGRFLGHRLKHQHLHHPKRDHVLAERVMKGERAVGDVVTATIDGQVVHWINQYAGPQTSLSTATALPAAGMSSICPYCSVQTTLTTLMEDSRQTSATSAIPAASSPINPLPPVGGTSGSGGSWSRQAYYNADTGTSDGLAFLNHFGGSQGKPGTADGGPA